MAEEIPNIVVTVTVEDPNLQTSNGLLPRLFNNSKRHAVRGDYLNCIQSEVLPWMRKQLVQWMLEVCEEQKLSIYVFPQATHLLDRYLSGQQEFNFGLTDWTKLKSGLFNSGSKIGPGGPKAPPTMNRLAIRVEKPFIEFDLEFIDL